jgi:hypothetical protein
MSKRYVIGALLTALLLGTLASEYAFHSGLTARKSTTSHAAN